MLYFWLSDSPDDPHHGSTMPRFLAVILLLTIIPTTASAGFGPDPDPRPMLDISQLESPRPDPVAQCALAGGISRADVVARDAQILREKFARISVGEIVTCTFDGDKIAVERYAGILVTTVDGKNRLVYDPAKASSLGSFDLVFPDMTTWSPPDCPARTAEWLVEEQNRRVFACHPESGYHVTTRAEDEETRKAYAEETRRLYGPRPKNPGI